MAGAGDTLVGRSDEPIAVPAGSAILRAFRILDALAGFDEPPQLAQIAAAVGLPKPTVLRILGTLEFAGLIAREPNTRRYTFSDRINTFASQVLLSSPVRAPRHAILEELVEQVGETCILAMPAGSYAQYLDRVEVPWPKPLRFGPGTRVPLHASASGKIFLGYMSKRSRDRFLQRTPLIAHTPRTLTDPARIVDEVSVVRDNGYAFDYGEFLSGVSCIAVPVRNAANKVVAAVAMSVPADRADERQLLEGLPAMRQAASAMAATFDW
jgi:IclR family acetate operon transcriptional repressor